VAQLAHDACCVNLGHHLSQGCRYRWRDDDLTVAAGWCFRYIPNTPDQRFYSSYNGGDGYGEIKYAMATLRPVLSKTLGNDIIRLQRSLDPVFLNETILSFVANVLYRSKGLSVCLVELAS
jgi:hypothetical protein